MKSLIIIGTLMSLLSGCYVRERHNHRYAAIGRHCAYGYHWNGHRCRANW
jgi:hypothetical protein